MQPYAQGEERIIMTTRRDTRKFQSLLRFTKPTNQGTRPV
jgi:hypothetical protein